MTTIGAEIEERAIAIEGNSTTPAATKTPSKEIILKG